MRRMPHRTVDNVIGGVVIPLVDVTKITAAEARIPELAHDLRDRIQSLETLLNLVPVGILIMQDNRTGEVRVNRYGASLLGQSGGSEADGARLVTSSPRGVRGERGLKPEEEPPQRAAASRPALAAVAGHAGRA